MAVFPPTGSTVNEVKAPTLVHFELRYDDPSGTYNVPLPAGTFVHEIVWFVSQAFTTSGSNASLTIGDDDAADNYADATDTALQTIDTVCAKASGAGQTKATGDYYPTATNLKFVFTAASAGATAGKVVGFVVLSNVRYDGIAAAAAA